MHEKFRVSFRYLGGTLRKSFRENKYLVGERDFMGSHYRHSGIFGN